MLVARADKRSTIRNPSLSGCVSFAIMPSIDLHFHNADLHFYNADYKLPLTTFYFLGHFCVGKVRFVGYSMNNVHSKSFSLRKVSG